MQRMTEEEKAKKDAVEAYLSRYGPAYENNKSLEQFEVSDYTIAQKKRNEAIMKEVKTVIALLDVTRGKTVIEKKFLFGLPWRKIWKDMDISRDTGYKYYREAMLQLYDIMIEHEIDFGHQTP